MSAPAISGIGSAHADRKVRACSTRRRGAEFHAPRMRMASPDADLRPARTVCAFVIRWSQQSIGQNSREENNDEDFVYDFAIIGATAFALFSATASVEAKKLGDWTCYDFLEASAGQKTRLVYFVQAMTR
jgi:hypothetical protein